MTLSTGSESRWAESRQCCRLRCRLRVAPHGAPQGSGEGSGAEGFLSAQDRFWSVLQERSRRLWKGFEKVLRIQDLTSLMGLEVASRMVLGWGSKWLEEGSEEPFEVVCEGSLEGREIII